MQQWDRHWAVHQYWHTHTHKTFGESGFTTHSPSAILSLSLPFGNTHTVNVISCAYSLIFLFATFLGCQVLQNWNPKTQRKTKWTESEPFSCRCRDTKSKNEPKEIQRNHRRTQWRGTCKYNRCRTIYAQGGNQVSGNWRVTRQVSSGGNEVPQVVECWWDWPITSHKPASSSICLGTGLLGCTSFVTTGHSARTS